MNTITASVICEAFWEREIDSEAVRWSGNLESIFGYPRAEVEEGFSWWRERVHPDDLEGVLQGSRQAISGRANGYSCEYRFRRKDDSWAWVASRAVILRDADGCAHRTLGAMIDVTKLKETDSRLRLFTEQLPARATVTDRELRVRWDGGAAYPGSPSTVGRTVSELFAESPDRERVLDGCRRALAGETVRLQIDDGSAAADLQLAPFRDPAGAIAGVVGLAFDTTERVRAEEGLRSLSRKLIQAQESERRALSNELHDDIGQILFSLKLRLERSGHHDGESITLVDSAIDRMRDMVRTLRPPLLDEYGLEASLRSHVERESARAGLAFGLSIGPLGKRAPLTVEVTCFRIAQEALSNVIRHAQARRVDVELHEAKGTLHLTVRDDGAGFDPPVARARSSAGASHGMLSMRERAGLVGGKLEIESALGQGTIVRASLPLDQRA